MNPTRVTGTPTNGTLKIRQKLLIIAGSIITIYGFLGLGYELWRRITGISSELRWNWIGLALFLLASGLVIIQTLNVFKVFEVAWAVYKGRLPGGRRWTDPPPETAPPFLPKEKWPTPDPLWRDPSKRTRRDD